VARGHACARTVQRVYRGFASRRVRGDVRVRRRYLASTAESQARLRRCAAAADATRAAAAPAACAVAAVVELARHSPALHHLRATAAQSGVCGVVVDAALARGMRAHLAAVGRRRTPAAAVRARLCY
jgi:hypothetical protein